MSSFLWLTVLDYATLSPCCYQFLLWPSKTVYDNPLTSSVVKLHSVFLERTNCKITIAISLIKGWYFITPNSGTMQLQFKYCHTLNFDIHCRGVSLWSINWSNCSFTYVCPSTWRVFQCYQMDQNPSTGSRSLEFDCRFLSTLHPCPEPRLLRTAVYNAVKTTSSWRLISLKKLKANTKSSVGDNYTRNIRNDWNRKTKLNWQKVTRVNVTKIRTMICSYSTGKHILLLFKHKHYILYTVYTKSYSCTHVQSSGRRRMNSFHKRMRSTAIRVRVSVQHT